MSKYQYISIVILLLNYTLPVSSTIIGEDGRVRLSKEQKSIPEYRQTGLLGIGGEGYGTGLLTGENCDVVLTAAHLVRYNVEDAEKYKNTVGNLRENWRLYFVPDPLKSNAGYHVTLVKSGFDNINNISSRLSKRAEYSHDWSILRLSTPGTTTCKQIRYIKNKTTCDGPIHIPAIHIDAYEDIYINDLTNDPCYTYPTDRRDIIQHNCDTKEGASGAPLFCMIEDEFYLIGINSGSTVPNKNYKEPDRGKSGAPFNKGNHANYAIPLHEEFIKAFEAELYRSKQRMDN